MVTTACNEYDPCRSWVNKWLYGWQTKDTTHTDIGQASTTGTTEEPPAPLLGALDNRDEGAPPVSTDAEDSNHEKPHHSEQDTAPLGDADTSEPIDESITPHSIDIDGSEVPSKCEPVTITSVEQVTVTPDPITSTSTIHEPARIVTATPTSTPCHLSLESLPILSDWWGGYFLPFLIVLTLLWGLWSLLQVRSRGRNPGARAAPGDDDDTDAPGPGRRARNRPTSNRTRASDVLVDQVVAAGRRHLPEIMRRRPTGHTEGPNAVPNPREGFEATMRGLVDVVMPDQTTPAPVPQYRNTARAWFGLSRASDYRQLQTAYTAFENGNRDTETRNTALQLQIQELRDSLAAERSGVEFIEAGKALSGQFEISRRTLEEIAETAQGLNPREQARLAVRYGAGSAANLTRIANLQRQQHRPVSSDSRRRVLELLSEHSGLTPEEQTELADLQRQAAEVRRRYLENLGQERTLTRDEQIELNILQNPQDPDAAISETQIPIGNLSEEPHNPEGLDRHFNQAHNDSFGGIRRLSNGDLAFGPRTAVQPDVPAREEAVDAPATTAGTTQQSGAAEQSALPTSPQSTSAQQSTSESQTPLAIQDGSLGTETAAVVASSAGLTSPGQSATPQKAPSTQPSAPGASANSSPASIGDPGSQGQPGWQAMHARGSGTLGPQLPVEGDPSYSASTDVPQQNVGRKKKSKKPKKAAKDNDKQQAAASFSAPAQSGSKLPGGEPPKAESSGSGSSAPQRGSAPGAGNVNGKGPATDSGGNTNTTQSEEDGIRQRDIFRKQNDLAMEKYASD